MLLNQYYVDPSLSSKIKSLQLQLKQLLRSKHQIQSNSMLKPTVKAQLLSVNQNHLVEVRKCIIKCKNSMVEYWDNQQIEITKKSIQKANNKSIQRNKQGQKQKDQSVISNKQSILMNRSKQSILINRSKQSRQTYHTHRNSINNQSYINSHPSHNNKSKQSSANLNEISFEINEFNLTSKSNNHISNPINSEQIVQNMQNISNNNINDVNSCIELSNNQQKRDKHSISELLRRQAQFNHKPKTYSNNTHINQSRNKVDKQSTNYKHNKRTKNTVFTINQRLWRQLNKKNQVIKCLMNYMEDLQHSFQVNFDNCSYQRELKRQQIFNQNKGNYSNLSEYQNNMDQISESSLNSRLSQSGVSSYFGDRLSQNLDHIPFNQYNEQLGQLNELVQLYKQKSMKLQYKLNIQSVEIAQLKSENQQLKQQKANSHYNNNNLLNSINNLKQLTLQLQIIKNENQTLKLERSLLLKKVNIKL